MVAKGLNTPAISTKRRRFSPVATARCCKRERKKRRVYLCVVARARIAELIKMPSGIFAVASERRESVSKRERRSLPLATRKRKFFLASESRGESSNLTLHRHLRSDYECESEGEPENS